MRRALKLVVCGAVVAAVGLTAVAGGGAHPVSGAIICPLEPAQTLPRLCCWPAVLSSRARSAAIPCCVCCGPPPAARSAAIPCCVCCGPPPAARSALVVCLPLTIAATPDPSTAGQKVTISGRLSAGTAGVRVQLWQQLPGASAFKPLASTTTGPSGAYRFVLAGVRTNRAWFVTAAGGRSFTLDQRVRAVVTVALSAGGHLVHGAVRPSHAGERVLVESRLGGRWHVVARPLLDGASRYRVWLALRDTFDLRTVLPADARNIRSLSPDGGWHLRR